jgi:hypothetical protein
MLEQNDSATPRQWRRDEIGPKTIDTIRPWTVIPRGSEIIWQKRQKSKVRSNCCEARWNERGIWLVVGVVYLSGKHF